MGAIQLSLIPERGFAIHTPWGMQEDPETGEPLLFTRKRGARRMINRLPSWGRHVATIVKVERHPAVEGANGLPTYVVL